MPDPNLPPLIMLSTPRTPRTPQPYQERILAALEDGSRFETWQERWVRERNESSERWNDAIEGLKEGFRAFGQGVIKTLASLAPLFNAMQRQQELDRGPTIGRKRRARRARGRRRGNA
jgi:hypothetical protein